MAEKNKKPTAPSKAPATTDKAQQTLDAALAALEAVDPERATVIRNSLAEKENEKKIEALLQSEADKQQAEKHYWIEINRLPEDTEGHVFVGAAGVSYQIEKGVRVPVPRSVVEILNHAEVSGYIPVVDFATNQKVLKPVKYKRYPFSVYGEAPPPAVERWKKVEEEKARARELRQPQGMPVSSSGMDELSLEDQPSADFPQ
jgi:hypothetical protein